MKEIKLLESLTGKKVTLKENYMSVDYWEDYRDGEHTTYIMADEFRSNPEKYIKSLNEQDYPEGGPLSLKGIEYVKDEALNYLEESGLDRIDSNILSAMIFQNN